MMNVLNKRWLSMGWRAMDPKDSEPMALVWIEALDAADVPHRHYDDLFRRAIRLRATRLREGLKCDDFSVEMMIACWPGLLEDLKEARIKEGRFLEANAASDCDLCYGSGMRRIEHPSDPSRSGFGRCDHGNL